MIRQTVLYVSYSKRYLDNLGWRGFFLHTNTYEYLVLHISTGLALGQREYLRSWIVLW